MISRIIRQDSVTDISKDVMRDDGKLKLMAAEEWRSFKWDDFRAFCHVKARYGIPTIELVDFIKTVIDGRSVIEIGAGAGDLGFHLGIKMTDNKQQEMPAVAASYKAMHQPVIKYPKDVEKRDALDAVVKYKPQVVVASWITPYAPHEMPYGSNPFGVKEDKILDLVETFIIVGNLDVHWDKPIRQYEHKTIHSPWIVSRAKDQNKNAIFIWDKRKND